MSIRSGLNIALLGWCAGFSAISLPALASIEPLAGAWVSFEFVDIETWDEGRCTMVFFLERRMDVDAADGKSQPPTGRYITRHHGRFLRNHRGECRAPGQERALGLFTNTRIWLFDAEATGPSSWVVHARFDRCTDSGCDSQHFTDDFKSRLELRADGTLVDLDNPNALGKARAFRPELMIEESSREVERGFDRVVRLAKNGEFERLTNSYVSPLSSARAEPARFAAALRPARDLLRKVIARETIERRLMHGLTSNDLGYAGDRYGVILRRLDLDDGSTGIEVGVLHETSGTWKLLDANWQ